MDIGPRLKRLRESQGLTLEQVGAHVGVNKATVQRYESGEIDIKRNVAIKLGEVLHASPAYIMGWSDEEPLPPNVRILRGTQIVPRLGMIACGEPILAEDNIEGYDEVPDWVRCDFTLTCKGDSMKTLGSMMGIRCVLRRSRRWRMVRSPPCWWTANGIRAQR